MRLKLEIAGGAILLALLLLVGYQQYNKAIENAKAEAKAEYDKAADAKIDAALKQRDAEYQKQLAPLLAAQAALQKATPAQIIKEVPVYIPQATAPITIAGRDSKPNVGDAIVPQADIKPIAQAVLDGEKCKLDLGKCQSDLGDWQQKYKLQEDETKQWKTAARGGSVWKRAGKVALAVGIGVGIGYAAHH